ncbi:YiiX/YebB-like N1pC/P60 family cysteine hydrolase [Halomonas sp. 328]|uniref:YiiX/YebB-like N1pC/P60 family cysteine hydrolase n=1 Tax=Halomonas sp. 328 TaxID=2776704 RepID=UPI0018A73FDB|nr:YiiX/YebB-like N1pC/P60 family cysteine hydrolase [Halomonas sp. 328]MBF8223745.1 hypothetical protein [Halomonas sp. 328]
MKIGDVLLVAGDSIKSSGLVAAQKPLYAAAVSSHVEIGLGDGTFVHATGDGGVHVVFILDELAKVKEGWRAIRLKGLTEEQEEELGKQALYFLRQGYNKAFMGKGTENSSFCSELVAKAYERAGIEVLNGKQPSKVAPAHFDAEADLQAEWEDVTDEYRERLVDIRENPFPYQLACQTIQATMARRHIFSKRRKNVFDMMEALSESDGDGRMKKLVDEVKTGLREGRNLHFWDEKDQG